MVYIIAFLVTFRRYALTIRFSKCSKSLMFINPLLDSNTLATADVFTQHKVASSMAVVNFMLAFLLSYMYLQVGRACNGTFGQNCDGQLSEVFPFPRIYTDSIRIACVTPCTSSVDNGTVNGNFGLREVFVWTFE